MAEVEGNTGVPSAPVAPATEGGQPASSNVPSLEQFQPDPATPATPQAQGTPQPSEDLAKKFQSIADQRLAQLYQKDQELAQLRQQMDARNQPQQQPETNPFDPSTQWDRWMEWRDSRLVNQVAEQTQRVMMQNLQGAMIRQSELAWQGQHPEVDIQVVKNFAQSRNIGNLDDALLIMNYNQNMGQVAQQTSQQAFQQFKQPQVGATAVHGAVNQPSQTTLSYEKLAKAYSDNPGIEASWPKELKEAFWQETYARRGSR